MTLRLIIDAKTAGRQLVHGMVIAQNRIMNSVAKTANEAAALFLRLGRTDIRGAGRFGRRWTEGLTADVNITPPASTITIFHKVPYWRVFEYGAVIRGKPMLWIPLSFANIPKGKRARDYSGQLFRVDRIGKAPLLLSRRDKKPKFFGKQQVRIPKKFHLRELAAAVGNRMREIYSKHFKTDAGT